MASLLTSSQAATRSMRPIVSSSSVSCGAVTQWMQLTGHVSIASCVRMQSGGPEQDVRHVQGGGPGTQLQAQGGAARQPGCTRPAHAGCTTDLQLLHSVHALVPHAAPHKDRMWGG